MRNHHKIYIEQLQSLKIILRGNPDLAFEQENIRRTYEKCITAKTQEQKQLVVSMFDHVSKGSRVKYDDTYVERCKCYMRVMAPFLNDWESEESA